MCKTIATLHIPAQPSSEVLVNAINAVLNFAKPGEEALVCVNHETNRQAGFQIALHVEPVERPPTLYDPAKTPPLPA